MNFIKKSLLTALFSFSNKFNDKTNTNTSPYNLLHRTDQTYLKDLFSTISNPLPLFYLVLNLASLLFFFLYVLSVISTSAIQLLKLNQYWRLALIYAALH